MGGGGGGGHGWGWGDGGHKGPNPMQALGPEEGGAGHNGKVPPTRAGITPTVLGLMTFHSPSSSSLPKALSNSIFHAF